MLEAGRQLRSRHGNADVSDQCRCAAAWRRHAGQALRLLRRHRRRRLAGAGRAVHQRLRRSRRDSSGGGARGCWAAARITGAASRCATGRTTSSRTAATAWASTGRSATRTSRRTTTRSRCSSASTAATKAWRTRRDSPPGVLLPPPKPRVGELLVASTRATLGIPVIPIHRAVLTKRLDDARLPANSASGQREGAAHPRGRHAEARRLFLGDALRSRLLDPGELPVHHRAPAAGAGTGNLDIVTDAMVREVTIDSDGKADRRVYIDKHDRRRAPREGARRHARGERARVGAHPAEFEVGASRMARELSGMVGKYIMDTVGASFGGQIPAAGESAAAQRGRRRRQPRVRAVVALQGAARGQARFRARLSHRVRRWTHACPASAPARASSGSPAAATARKFKEDARRYYGSFVSFAGRGEMIPNDDCYCELDPTLKDKWGIPVAALPLEMVRARARPGRAHAEDVRRASSMRWAARYSSPPQTDGDKAIKQGGDIIHEVGGAIMGSDPKKSVTNSLGQTLGREEPVPHRRRDAVLERGQESDAHDHGARVARVRSHARRHEEEGAVSMDRRTSIKWMLAAATAMQSLSLKAGDAAGARRRVGPAGLRHGSGSHEELQSRRALAAHALASTPD